MTHSTGFVARLGDRAPITCPDTPLMLIGRAPRADGSYGRPAPDAPLPRDPSDASLWQPGQGQANACGTTTLAYILDYLLGGGAPTRDRIDDGLRRGNTSRPRSCWSRTSAASASPRARTTTRAWT